MIDKKRTKTPIILQMEAVECGAAALAIILAYYQCYISLEELRYACGVSRDGSKAVNMLRAARSYGLKAQGAEAGIEDLPELTYPCIAFWEFNHFVVIEGYDENTVYLNDPDCGLRSISYEEFSLGYTGVVLLFEPAPDFVKIGQKNTLWYHLKSRLVGARKTLFFIILCSLVLVIPNVMVAGFAKIFIDDVLIHQFSGWLLPLLWGMLFTAVLRALLTWVEEIHLMRLHLKIIMTSTAQFVWRVFRLPMSFFSQRYSGDIASRIAANDSIAKILSHDLSTNLVGLINMAFYALIMFFYDWVLAVIALLFALINASLLLYIARGMANNTTRLLQDEGKLAGIEVIGIEGIETLKTSGMDDDYFQRWAGFHAKTINSQQQIALYTTFINVMSPLLMGLSTALVLGVGGLRIMDGYLTVGALVGFQSLFISFNQPLTALLALGSKLQEIRADLSRLNDVLLNPEDPELINKNIEEGSELLAVNQLDPYFAMKEISFGYSPLDPPLINKLNLTLTPGKAIAIVGSSGSGKSTIAKLACGLYTPWSGEVLLGNLPFSKIPRKLISHTLSYVDQDIFLFEGTLRDNITMWDPNITPSAIKQAIADAELTDLIKARPDGLDSLVVTQGSNFSGGQRQQLELARALVTMPRFLILDEATAALDSITEAKIIANLKKRKCTLLMVAHRLSTIRLCDEILVVHNGTIIERGTHDALVQKEGEYNRLLLEMSRAEL